MKRHNQLKYHQITNYNFPCMRNMIAPYRKYYFVRCATSRVTTISRVFIASHKDALRLMLVFRRETNVRHISRGLTL